MQRPAAFVPSNAPLQLLLTQHLLVSQQKSRMMKACKDATITIYVKEGKDISPMDHDGLADPFCEVHINGKKKGKTSVCKNTLTPKWSPPAEFSFDVADLISGDQVAESIEIKVNKSRMV
ncbi:hypothetical protein SARC_17554 [Sphaeroforma arctica JP610]|uniref:C2 domain-containing protein n=1 Tax=Sphaeroforma arctica JP610 TaxID=667725 RepID=A0A0L0EZV1_9EUKA|nr:hypothetical protein SARC_17554 [Sphaeroforma arctica JP610]KNC69926.1 hypothetical protein SARC_17554 [Sphaeroforma arctica JP610]|eukprot:XP_014143828.1 hypothetical protein SARC_17554 [Sphaeroforma arctica JP610]